MCARSLRIETAKKIRFHAFQKFMNGAAPLTNLNKLSETLTHTSSILVMLRIDVDKVFIVHTSRYGCVKVYIDTTTGMVMLNAWVLTSIK